MEGMLILAKDFSVSLIGWRPGFWPSQYRERNSIRMGPMPRISAFAAGQMLAIGFSSPVRSALRYKWRNISVFTPRVSEALWLVERKFTNTMVDVSDGLLKDLGRVCQASDVSAVLNEDSVPRTRLDNSRVPLANTLLDGEDYELLFAVSPSKCEKLLGKWPFFTRLTDIGSFVQPNSQSLVVNEKGIDLITKFGQGFDHFTSTGPVGVSLTDELTNRNHRSIVLATILLLALVLPPAIDCFV